MLKFSSIKSFLKSFVNSYILPLRIVKKLKFSNKPSAFSLIELTIVILIIGILIAAVVKGSSMLQAFRLKTARTITQSAPVTAYEGLSIWLDSTSESAYKKGEGIENNSLISTFFDTNPQSINKITLTQNTSTLQPNYKKSAINGLPALTFDNSDDLLESDDITLGNILDSKQVTVFLVQTPSEPVTGSSSIAFGTSNFKVTVNKNTAGITFGSSGTAAALGSTKPSFFTFVKSDSSLTIRTNGENKANISQTSNNVLNLADTGKLFVGKQIDSAIGEVIIYNKALKDKEIVAIETYLAKKWRIDAAISHSTTLGNNTGSIIQQACNVAGQPSSPATDGQVSGGCISYGNTWGQIYTAVNGSQYFFVDNSGNATAFNEKQGNNIFINEAYAQVTKTAKQVNSPTANYTGPSHRPLSCKNTGETVYKISSEKYYDNGLEFNTTCDTATGDIKYDSNNKTALTVDTAPIGNVQNGGKTNEVFYNNSWQTIVRKISNIPYIDNSGDLINANPLNFESIYTPQDGDVDTLNGKKYNSTTQTWEDYTGPVCSVSGTGINTGTTVTNNANTVTCNSTGYSGTVSLSDTCTIDGQALTISTPCSAITCNITNTVSGVSATTVTSGSSSVNCTAPGYTGSATLSAPCTTQGQNLTITGSCTALTCNVTGTGITPGTTVANAANTVNCNAPGYSGTATLSGTCTTHNETLTLTSACSTVTCNVSGTGITNTTVGYNASSQSLSCNAAGYTGTATVPACTTNGANLTATGCNPITCNVSGTGIAPGATVNYNASSQSLSCNESGYTGTATVPACTTNGANLTATGCTLNGCTVATTTGINPNTTVEIGATGVTCNASGYYGYPALSATCTTPGSQLTVTGSCTSGAIPGSGGTVIYGSIGASPYVFHFFYAPGDFIFSASATANQKHNLTAIIISGGGASLGYGGGGGAEYGQVTVRNFYGGTTPTTTYNVLNVGRGINPSDSTAALTDQQKIESGVYSMVKFPAPYDKAYTTLPGVSGNGDSVLGPNYNVSNPFATNLTYSGHSVAIEQYRSGQGGGGIGTQTAQNTGSGNSSGSGSNAGTGSALAGGGGGAGAGSVTGGGSAVGSTPGSGGGCFGPSGDTSPNNPVKYLVCGGAGGRNVSGVCGTIMSGANACGQNPKPNTGSGANADIPRSGASGVVVFFYPTS